MIFASSFRLCYPQRKCLNLKSSATENRRDSIFRLQRAIIRLISLAVWRGEEGGEIGMTRGGPVIDFHCSTQTRPSIGQSIIDDQPLFVLPAATAVCAHTHVPFSLSLDIRSHADRRENRRGRNCCVRDQG